MNAARANRMWIRLRALVVGTTFSLCNSPYPIDLVDIQQAFCLRCLCAAWEFTRKCVEKDFYTTEARLDGMRLFCRLPAVAFIACAMVVASKTRSDAS